MALQGRLGGVETLVNAGWAIDWEEGQRWDGRMKRGKREEMGMLSC